jgi:hypothetical protein
MAISKWANGIDEALKQWCTPRQAEFIDAINKCGSAAQAAKMLNVNTALLTTAIKSIEAKAAKAGYAPGHDMTHPVPDGFAVKGVSTYYDSEGQVRGQWVKSNADDVAREAAIKAAYAAMADELPRIAPVKSPSDTSPDLLNLFTFSDYHLGMRAEARISGEPWNIGIAERLLSQSFDYMIGAAPKAGTAFINQLGDFLHHDALLPVTPTHGHVLDADCSLPTMAEAAVRVLRRMIDRALETHAKVVVLLAEGNHDLVSSVWLRLLFRTLYEREPRVTIIDSESPYYAYQHGNVMLAFHHGHLSKNEALPLLFATRFSAMWGATKFRIAHTGHRHHKRDNEFAGMEVFQHPTLATADAHSNRGGWDAQRRAIAITYHTQEGEGTRLTVTPGMLAA